LDSVGGVQSWDGLKNLAHPSCPSSLSLLRRWSKNFVLRMNLPSILMPKHCRLIFCWSNQWWESWASVNIELYWSSRVYLFHCVHSSRIEQLDGKNGTSEMDKLWKHPSSRDFVPCVAPNSSYSREKAFEWTISFFLISISLCYYLFGLVVFVILQLLLNLEVTF